MAGARVINLRKLSIAALCALVAMAGMASVSHASPQHPTLAEVNSVIDALKFRGTMQNDPAKAISGYSVDYGRASLNEFDRQMKAAGINTGAGWRYFLSTSVFTATGLTQKKMLVVFYNPWIDSALFTVWQPVGKSRRIVDAAWVPGDLVRKANAEINPTPLWLRGKGYRPDKLAQSVVTTVKAVEARFGDPRAVPGWRKTLGVVDARTCNRLVVPLLALALDDTLMRVRALAIPVPGEDPRLAPLRTAALNVIVTSRTTGFTPLLTEAKDTTAPMKAILARINPKTMVGLAPVAFVAGKQQVTMFFASTATADYMISARFVDKGNRYGLAQLEFIPYAAVYSVATAKGMPK